MNFDYLIGIGVLVVIFLSGIAMGVELVRNGIVPSTPSVSEAEQLCLSHSPGEEWDVTLATSYPVGYSQIVLCDYETVPKAGYAICAMEFKETANHGFVKTLDTCGWV